MATRNSRRIRRLRLAPAVAGALSLLPVPAAMADQVSKSAADQLRVCADPNNLPFSNKEGEGFENKLAEMVANDLGKKGVTYTWWAQRRGFVRSTLKAGDCDVIMGVPAHMDMVETTQPYYRSTYVFVTRTDRDLDISSLKDRRLGKLSIGVHLIGDDGANTPPADALGREGIVDNVVGYMIYGDYRQSAPPARLIEGVEKGSVDVAAAWGPLAGYFAKRSPVPLTLTPIADRDDFKPLRFEFSISMGVRKGDHALRGHLDEVINRERPAIRRLLERYGVPLVAMNEDGADGSRRINKD